MFTLLKKLDQRLVDFFSYGKPNLIAESIYKILTVNNGYGFKIFRKPLFHTFNYLLNKQNKMKLKYKNSKVDND